MPGGLWSRIKVWALNEEVSSADLNAEFNNVINNQLPAQFDDYSVSVAQMRQTSDPGEEGTESQATSLAGEIERIRHIIREITGQTYWYESPPKSLSAGTIQPLFYLPFNGGVAEEAYGDSIRRGAIINAASYNAEDFAQADLDSTNKKFGKFSYALGAGNILGAYAPGGRSEGSLSFHFRNVDATDYLVYNPLAGIELSINGAGRLVAKITEKTAASESTKDTVSITGTNTISGVSTFKHILLKYLVNGAAGASSDQLALKLDGTAEGTQLTAQDIQTNPGNGGVWFFGAKRNDPTWDHFYAASGLPTAHTSAWTATGAGSGAVSSGVLTITTTGTQGLNYNRSSLVDMSQQTLEWKMKIDSISFAASAGAFMPETSPVEVFIRDHSMSRAVAIQYTHDGVIINPGLSTGPQYKFFLNVFDWHVYRLTLSGSGSPELQFYVDGVRLTPTTDTGISEPITIGSDSSTTYSTSEDVISFGDPNNATATHNAVSQWEYFAVYDAGAEAPITADTQGNLDDIMMMDSFLGDSALESALSSTQASVAIGKDAPNNIGYGVTPPSFGVGTTGTSTVAAFEDLAFVPSDGLTPIEITTSGSAGINNAAGVVTVWTIIDGNGDEITAPSAVEAKFPHAQITPANTSALIPFSFSHKAVLKPGLRQIGVAFGPSSGAHSASLINSNLFIVINYER